MMFAITFSTSIATSMPPRPLMGLRSLRRSTFRRAALIRRLITTCTSRSMRIFTGAPTATSPTITLRSMFKPLPVAVLQVLAAAVACRTRDFIAFIPLRNGKPNPGGEDANSHVGNPRFVDASYPVDDYHLRNLWLDIPFVPFDVDAPGRLWFGPRLEAPPIAPTFLTETYDSATDF